MSISDVHELAQCIMGLLHVCATTTRNRHLLVGQSARG
jgi:hypothetical protein